MQNVQHTERTTLSRQTGQGNLEVNANIVRASEGEDSAGDVALAGRVEGGDVGNTGGVVLLNSSVAQLACNRSGIGLSGDSRGQHSNGCNSLEEGRHNESGDRWIEGR